MNDIDRLNDDIATLRKKINKLQEETKQFYGIKVDIKQVEERLKLLEIVDPNDPYFVKILDENYKGYIQHTHYGDRMVVIKGEKQWFFNLDGDKKDSAPSI